MAQAYCVKEKAKREVSGAHEVRLRNGRRAIEGSCPSCGIKLFRILGSDEAWAAAGPDAISTAAEPVRQQSVVSLEPALTELSYRPQDLDAVHVMLLASPPAVRLLQNPDVQQGAVATDMPAVPEPGPTPDLSVTPGANSEPTTPE
jgi:hypothetical protein